MDMIVSIVKNVYENFVNFTEKKLLNQVVNYNFILLYIV